MDSSDIRGFFKLEHLWPIAATVFGILYWYGNSTGALQATITRQSDQIGQISNALDILRQADKETSRSVDEARAERFRQMDELRAEISRNSARIEASRDVTMMLERRLELLEAEKRNGK